MITSKIVLHSVFVMSIKLLFLIQFEITSICLDVGNLQSPVCGSFHWDDCAGAVPAGPFFTHIFVLLFLQFYILREFVYFVFIIVFCFSSVFAKKMFHEINNEIIQSICRMTQNYIIRWKDFAGAVKFYCLFSGRL